MKKMITMAVLMTIAITASAMTYNEARHEALFLSDKMAYELNLSSAQYEDVYEINLDYLLCVNHSADLFGIYWERRNADLRFVLTSWQYDRYMATSYFFRPLSWVKSSWVFSVYSHYAAGRLFNAHPKVYVSYRGGHNRLSSSHYAHRAVNKPAVNVVNHTVHIGKPMAAVGKTTTAGARRTGTINSAPVASRTATAARCLQPLAPAPELPLTETSEDGDNLRPTFQHNNPSNESLRIIRAGSRLSFVPKGCQPAGANTNRR